MKKEDDERKIEISSSMNAVNALLHRTTFRFIHRFLFSTSFLRKSTKNMFYLLLWDNFYPKLNNKLEMCELFKSDLI